MKKLTQMLCLTLALLCALPAWGMAESQEEFERSCVYKTANGTSVHDFTQAEPGNIDDITDDQYVIDYIPAGTYVQVESSGGSNGQWKWIVYMKNGVKSRGWAKVSLQSCASMVRQDDGYLHSVHENDPEYDQKLSAGTVEYDVKSATANYGESPAAAPSPAPMAESADKNAISQAYNDTTYTVIYYQYAYNPAGHVDLLRYGFDGVTGTLENGSKVAVTGMQEKGYTYIQYGSTYGWVKNSDLVSKLPEGTEEKDLKNVSYRYLVGDYMAPVYLYANPGDAEDIGSLSAGAGILVAVHEWQGGWAYITFGGWKGWIKSSFLSVSNEEKRTARQTKSSGGSASASASGGGKSKAIPAQVLESGQSVSVVTLGTVDSEITAAGEKRMIPTAELSFGADAPRDQQTAVIYAPRTGRASLRRAASASAAVLKNCKAGVIVAVLKRGEDFTQVCCQGTVGYVKTSSLRFSAPSEAASQAVLTYKGRTGGATVNVRCAPDRESAVVAVWDAGTAVTVLSFSGGWYEIEARGIHGYVMEEFVTVGR